MSSLSAEQIIRLWETGQRQHPLDRALTCLTFVFPEISWDRLAALSVGQRDAYLLWLRENTFGTQLDSLASCPHCQEQLEFSLTTTDLRVTDLASVPDPAQPQVHHCQVDDLALQFRLPTSVDLAAVISLTNPVAARRHLAQRCLVQAQQQGQALDLEVIPEDAIATLSDQLSAADPQAELLLDLDCPACGHHWQVLFDIVEFFWNELAAQAQRLLLEVHRLARFYGWREADILAMTNLRRQYYLELAS